MAAGIPTAKARGKRQGFDTPSSGILPSLSRLALSAFAGGHGIFLPLGIAGCKPLEEPRENPAIRFRKIVHARGKVLRPRRVNGIGNIASLLGQREGRLARIFLRSEAHQKARAYRILDEPARPGVMYIKKPRYVLDGGRFIRSRQFIDGTDRLQKRWVYASAERALDLPAEIAPSHGPDNPDHGAFDVADGVFVPHLISKPIRAGDRKSCPTLQQCESMMTGTLSPDEWPAHRVEPDCD